MWIFTATRQLCNLQILFFKLLGGAKLPQCQSTNIWVLSLIANYVLVHILSIGVKIKKLGVYFRNKSCFPYQVRKKKKSSRYISTDSGLWGCGLPACLLLPSFFLGCFVPRCSEIYNWLYIFNHHFELYERVAWPSLRIEKNALIGSFAKLSLMFYTKEFVWKSFITFSTKL